MSGLKSRRKGMRGEYLVRDALRAVGYTVDRVPASGASQGFKGDLRVRTPDGRELVAEVKLRKTGFSKMYKVADLRAPAISIGSGQWAVIISYDPKYIIEEQSVIYHEESGQTAWFFDKYLDMKQGCDFLVLKQDHMRPIYMKWVNRA